MDTLTEGGIYIWIESGLDSLVTILIPKRNVAYPSIESPNSVKLKQCFDITH